MKDKRVIGYFAAGLLTAAALYGIYVLVHPMTVGDDEPIVVAGGSLDIGSINGWEKDPKDSYVANAKHRNRKVTGGVIMYNDGVPRSQPLSGGPIKFEIAYCPAPHPGDKCADPNKPDDKITISTYPDTTHLSVSNTNKYHKMGDEADAANAAKSTTISHQPDWKVNRIRDVVHNNKDYPCVTGPCSVVLIYHCDNTGHC